MKRLALVILASAGLMAGCTHTYVITLNNGTHLTTASKPRLDHGNYVYKDAAGQLLYVPAGRVREVSPASMAQEEKAPFNPSPSR